MELAHNQEAVVDFDKTIEINPQCADSYSHRGSANIQLGRYQEAIVDFDKAKAIKLESKK